MNYTSIEQSKKLLELGVNPDTADMKYFILPDDNKEQTPSVGFKLETKRLYDTTDMQYLPCWSVGALLDLLPKLGSKSPKLLKFIKDNKSVYCATYQSKEYHSGFFSTSVDAVFDLLLKVQI